MRFPIFIVSLVASMIGIRVAMAALIRRYQSRDMLTPHRYAVIAVSYVTLHYVLLPGLAVIYAGPIRVSPLLILIGVGILITNVIVGYPVARFMYKGARNQPPTFFRTGNGSEAMASTDESVAYNIERLQGSHSEDAYHRLLEMGPAILPALIKAYKKESDLETRAALVNVIWQARCPESLSFLEQVLQEDEESLWKMALDGIVVLGTPEGVRLLKEEKERLLASEDRTRLIWIEESIEQIEAGM